MQSKLEDKMDSAIERGEFGEASAISDRLAQREVRTTVALDANTMDMCTI